jgi:hypothetical protein
MLPVVGDVIASGLEFSRLEEVSSPRTGLNFASALRTNHPTIWIKYSTVPPEANSYRKL